jgi:hypothetical protein
VTSTQLLVQDGGSEYAMTYDRQTPGARKIIKVALSVALSWQALLFSQQPPKVVTYSSNEFQDHVRISFSELRTRSGLSSWSMLIQKKTPEKLHIVVLNCAANSRMSAYYRAYQSNADGRLTLDGVDLGKDAAVRVSRWKALAVSDKKLSRLISELGKAHVSVLTRVAERLDGNYYSFEIVNPPVSLSIKFNSIEPHAAPLAKLLDEIVGIAAD